MSRHLWRMCFALFIAAGSFFSIRERVATILPEPFTTGPMRALPIVLLFGAMFYWLWRVRGRRPLTGMSAVFSITCSVREFHFTFLIDLCMQRAVRSRRFHGLPEVPKGALRRANPLNQITTRPFRTMVR